MTRPQAVAAVFVAGAVPKLAVDGKMNVLAVSPGVIPAEPTGSTLASLPIVGMLKIVGG